MTSEFAVAVHAIVYLNQHGLTVSSEELASNICTNPARVRKIMSKLKKAGFITAKEGKTGGGYSVSREMGGIDLYRIFKAVDDKIVTSSWRPGSADMDCFICSGMASVMSSIYRELDEACFEKLKTITVDDVRDSLLNKC